MYNCKEILHDLAGAVWRLQEYKYMRFQCDDEEQGQMEHWISIMNDSIRHARKLANEDIVQNDES